MKNKRTKLHEDITPVAAIAPGTTLEELYDDLGDELFDDANIPHLKAAGLIDEDGYPVSSYENYNGEISHGVYDCEDIYAEFDCAIDKPYIQELFKKEIREAFADGNRFNYDIEDLPNFHELDDKFIQGCFTNNVWEFFWDNYDLSLSDCSTFVDDIPEETIDYLESLGFPRDIFNQLVHGDADDESKLAKYYDDLEIALRHAVEDAYASGSAAACQRDFDDAWDDSIPDGCAWEGESDDSRLIRFTDNFIESNLVDIWEMFDRYASAGECVRFFIIELINDELINDFREPYYGWSDYDQEAFEDAIHEFVREIDFEEEPQEEEDLLKFNGDKGEYEEELDEDITPVRLPFEKPKKLYYQYKEWNNELSSKAYYLDWMRVDMLLDWCKKYDISLYNDIDRNVESDIEEVGQYLSGIIISKIKPSYADAYGMNAYTIWSIDHIGYDTHYLGAIPKGVGDRILKGIPLEEEIEVVPIPLKEETLKDKFYSWQVGGENFNDVFSQEDIDYMKNHITTLTTPIYRCEMLSDNNNKNLKVGDTITYDRLRSFSKTKAGFYDVMFMWDDAVTSEDDDVICFKTKGDIKVFDVEKEFDLDYSDVSMYDDFGKTLNTQAEIFVEGTFKIVDKKKVYDDYTESSHTLFIIEQIDSNIENSI